MKSDALMILIVCSAVSLGCSATDAPTEPAPPAAAPPVLTPGHGVVSSNHPAPHQAIISDDQLAAGAALVIDITGEAFHGHTISMTAQQVQQVAQKIRVSVTSTLDPHSSGTGHHLHNVTFN